MRRPTDRPIKVALVNKEKSAIERASAYVPLFVSALALSVSVYSAYETRDHNRMSARPITGFFLVTDETAPKVGIYLQNDGLGPARISGFTVFLDSKKIETNGRPDWDLVTHQLGGMFGGYQPEWFRPKSELVLKPGDRLALYVTPPNNVSNISEFRRLLLQRLIVRIHMCSLYEECEDECSGEFDCDVALHGSRN